MFSLAKLRKPYYNGVFKGARKYVPMGITILARLAL